MVRQTDRRREEEPSRVRFVVHILWVVIGLRGVVDIPFVVHDIARRAEHGEDSYSSHRISSQGGTAHYGWKLRWTYRGLLLSSTWILFFFS